MGKITRRKERDVQNVLLEESVIFAEQPKTTETGTTPFTQQSDVLLKQLEVAQQKLDKDDTVGSKQRETFERDIKDITSRVAHLRKESIKDTKEARFLTGPLGATAQVVHERSLHKKLLENTQKTTILLAHLSEELTGKDIKIKPVMSINQGLESNQRILQNVS